MPTYRQFPDLASAQTYADQQTALANLPAGGVTVHWSQPVLLADGTYVVQCFYDPTAVLWQAGWALPTFGV
jgi:hypothetical protein